MFTTTRIDQRSRRSQAQRPRARKPDLGLVLFGMFVLFLAGCQEQSATAPSPPTSSTQPASAITKDPSPRTTHFHDFSVDVTLSPAAKARLLQGGEIVIVSAEYFAWPVPAAEDQADDVGRLDLGRAQRELAGEGRTVFDDTGFRADRMALVKDQPQVNVNVFSGRKTADDNLLNCDFFQDALQAAAAAPIILHCSLIEEGATSRSLP